MGEMGLLFRNKVGAGPPGDTLGDSSLRLPAFQHLAHREERKVPQLLVHGLAGDPVAGPQTSSHSDPREPGKCAHLLLPISTGVAIPAQGQEYVAQAGTRLAPVLRSILLCMKL